MASVEQTPAPGRGVTPASAKLKDSYLMLASYWPMPIRSWHSSGSQKVELWHCLTICNVATAQMAVRSKRGANSLQGEVEELFQAAFDKAFPTLHEIPMVTPTKPKDSKFGDYQCNSAMKLFNSLRGQVKMKASKSCPLKLDPIGFCTVPPM